MERLTLRDDDGRALLTPYGLRVYCSTQATADCICKLEEALQVQEPVEPTIGGDADGPCGNWWYQCGKCKEAIDYHDSYCRNCGRAVKWG